MVLIVLAGVTVAHAAKDDTMLVSVTTGVEGTPGNDMSSSPAVSADGRLVAFESNASNLDPADSDNSLDVFVRDVQAGTTILVSRATGQRGGQGRRAVVQPGHLCRRALRHVRVVF